MNFPLEPLPTRLAYIIARVVEGSELSKTEVARRLGVSLPGLSKWMNPRYSTHGVDSLRHDYTESEKSCMFEDFFEAVWPARCCSDQDTERVGKRYGIRDMDVLGLRLEVRLTEENGQEVA
ncbi:MAG: hypothetical protein H7095_02385 [Pseudopedobacter sp.]|nr:hypothetical protein [Deinococcales bacterium]